MGPARGTCFLLRFRTNRHGCDADFTILRLWPVYTAPLSLTCALPQFCHAHSSHARAARAVQDGLSADACAGRAGAAGLPGVVDQCVRAGHDDRPYPCSTRRSTISPHTSRWLELIGHRMVLAPAHRRGPGRGGRGAGRLQGAGLEAGARVALAVAATCLLGQLAVSQLKHYTTLPRPYDLETLGGYTPYPLHWWTCASPGGRCIAQRARRRGLCHAEPVFRRLGDGAAGLALAGWPWLGAGLGFSAVRVLQGAHFLSQTVWSAALLWFLGAVVFYPLIAGRGRLVGPGAGPAVCRHGGRPARKAGT